MLWWRDRMSCFFTPKDFRTGYLRRNRDTTTKYPPTNKAKPPPRVPASISGTGLTPASDVPAMANIINIAPRQTLNTLTTLFSLMDEPSFFLSREPKPTSFSKMAQTYRALYGKDRLRA